MADTRIEAQRDIRDDLVDTLSRELLGPFDGPDETLRQRPTGKYLVGRLAPAGTQVGQEEDEGTADIGAGDENADAGYASPISMAMNPSSIGLSFTIDCSIQEIEITACWGTYAEHKREVERRDGATVEAVEWARTEHTHRLTIAVADPDRLEVDGGVEIQWLCRTLPDGKRRAVSVFLVNRVRSTNPGRPDDSEWLFQPTLLARHPDGFAVFQSRSLNDVLDFDALDPDRRADELLFRERPECAVGHGCAADWDAQGGAGATEVRTTVLPIYELARVDPRGGDDPGLDMRKLGGSHSEGLPGDQLEELLSPLADAYGNWVEGLASRVNSLDARLREQADEHIDGCRRVHQRIEEGIRLLCRSDDETSLLARRAFCFANRAMALQRAHSAVALQRRRGEAPGSPDDVPATWRPFQLAFFLMNLPPLVDRTHPRRRACDLLWFPTGGGKTEAYLGLAAFVLALRRIRTHLPGYRADGGVGVLMRYTLRLLTVQQFQRATALACACELLRAQEGVWGSEPFSIGLWVGTSVTPNHFSNNGSNWDDGAKEALDKWRDDKRIRGGTPAQLLSCPWCGAQLGPLEYFADEYEQRVKIYCSDDSCEFAPANDWGLDGIPAHTVDEQVYRHTPSLIIATVDKFAQMAWNGRVQSLFGRVQRHCERHGYISTGEKHPASRHNADHGRGWPQAEIVDVEPFEPPDLVIQDELHLISGPLGTLVGLYETAVDGLASVEEEGQRFPPKIVASTATIRRADRQVGSLFHRSLMIFPPLGLDSTDSWFGMEAQPEQDPGRLYLGVFAPGKSVKTALVRAYATLLSRARRLHEGDPEAGDAYMTLIGYFNSLRELGGAVRLAEDDVPGRIRVLASQSKEEFANRLLYERHELTSNKTADEVPEILGRLERQFPAGTPQRGMYPVDVLFASNMISVGVDIDRLGLMVVNGQPKTTAEYIQATSRVGRQTPGLVVTVYNWTRPRDISHYERFRSYHEGLYRHVEPASVTPFSSRARDKGLAGVFASLVRQGDPGMAPENAAGNFDPANNWVRQAIDLVCDRAAHMIAADEAAETKAELLGLVDKWVDKKADGDLPWSRRGRGGSPAPDSRWLIDQQEDGDGLGAFVAPGSLREIESEVHIHLLDRNDGTA
ncbi:DISARM system helicase DrmA [Candidatus Poriferisodalis sp.]|uniref:DISARM system helicase DrmA n=1 Tax=Candidatus Poriferisodalis sp. TaxID=3101277 RepID=UPI003D0FC703